MTFAAYSNANAAPPFSGVPGGGTIVSGSQNVQPLSSATVLVTPAKGQFLLTTVCGSPRVLISGISFGFIALVDEFIEPGWQCYNFEPGVALPPNEEVSCQASCGLECPAQCQVSGIVREEPPYGEQVISDSTLVDHNVESEIAFTIPSEGQFILTTVCADNRTAFEGNSFGFIANVRGGSDVGDKRYCYNFAPGVALPQGEDIVCRKVVNFADVSYCQVSGILKSPRGIGMTP
jgi:hypothetical protein